DSQNNLIIGLLGQGVDVFDREKGVFTHYKTKVEDNTTLLGNFIRFIFEDSKQNVWIGTEIGLNRFDISSGTFERYRSIREDSTTLSGKDVRTISESGRGNLWFGTTSGVSLYDPPSNSFIRHEVNSKLPSIVVNGILEDDVGNLWISTNEGLSRYNLDSKDIENFKKTDGLQGMEFSARAAIKSRYGNYMFFGGTNGMNMFNPSSIGRSDKEVGVVFSEIRLFDEPINQGDTVNGRVLLEKDLSITKEITLTHEENVLALAFSALDYTAPDKNLFAYKLGGFDEDETVVDARNRKITYTNLDPGHYTFQVKASNHDGLFSSDNYIEMGIIVLPPWWQTWWFRILLVITVISLIYFIANWRFRILNNQKRVLQDEVDKHTGKLKEVIEILRLKSNQISTSGFNLKQKSGMLAEDARLQTESAKRIEGSIEVVINHTRKNTENAVKTNNISENTVRELARIREANEENLNENRIISSKIEALEEIFKQTNILAINAAIQAARAGTYGSGFSIIANEVKKLAERSRVASLEISGSAQNGSNKTEEMERLLIEFVPEIEKSVNLIKEISQSSKEQTNSVDVMTQSLREFFNISRKNAEISSEIHVISSELDELAKYLNDQVQNIRL
ncbi:MAG: methyl-accepting chemotaxis protein, partial [Bacteroidota bacterium]